MYDELLNDLGRFSSDPLGFVYWAFPWGEGELRDSQGPEPWQAEILKQIGQGLLDINKAVQIAVTSGHGVGKSALVAWLVLWSLSTCTDTTGVVTANTETQLKTKTWRQVSLWYHRFIAKSLFKLTATGLFSVDPDREKTWRFDMVPWSVNNTEAFAGLHNLRRRVVLLMDEASGIDDIIWEVAEGLLTDANTERLWCAFGNPTKNKGRFRDCFKGGKFESRWQTLAVDSRTVSFTNKDQITTWIEDYGDDSDFVRIRVKGEFPRIDAESFISYDLAISAVGRQFEPRLGEALILGVDVGRYGEDPSVIYPRRGRDASSYPVHILPGFATTQTAAKVVEVFNQLNADIAMIDGGGVGGGVVDQCRLLGIPVIDVQFGSKAMNANVYTRGEKYYLKRSEMWGEMRGWLSTGAIQNPAVPTLDGSVRTLVDELIAPNYGLNNRDEIQLERKEDMRSRGVPSPNVADALACTFALPSFVSRTAGLTPRQPTLVPEYDPYEKSRIYA